VAALDDFNDEPADQAVQALRACNGAPRFAAAIVAGRPYRDVETLVRRAEDVVRALPWDDVAIALAAHPRIGDRVDGSSAEAASSRREQRSMDDVDAATRDALRDGNRAYEERFDHVFLIRASGRSPEEMLAELHRRLDSDEETERAEVTEQLAQITGIRVRELVTGAGLQAHARAEQRRECDRRAPARRTDERLDARPGLGHRTPGRRDRRPAVRR
jgi:2-oxo-4-hydroxy-4-carboxy-5-ureidoimidazoline decarboxylase